MLQALYSHSTPGHYIKWQNTYSTKAVFVCRLGFTLHHIVYF